MGQFDQFANQGGAAAWDPDETAEAKRVAEEQLKNADYAGDLPEPLSQGPEPTQPSQTTAPGQTAPVQTDGSDSASDESSGA